VVLPGRFPSSGERGTANNFSPSWRWQWRKPDINSASAVIESKGEAVLNILAVQSLAGRTLRTFIRSLEASIGGVSNG